MADPVTIKARIVGLEPFRVVALDVQNGQGAYHRSSLQLSESFKGNIDRILEHIGEPVMVEVLDGEILRIKGVE